MGRPTEEELNTALIEAARLREQGEDTFFMGKSLLNLNYRLQSLERVMEKSKRFLHSGLSARENTELKIAIEKAEKACRGEVEDNKFTGI